jgi:predicted Fe-Mo cluster-binding NifX family protein
MSYTIYIDTVTGIFGSADDIIIVDVTDHDVVELSYMSDAELREYALAREAEASEL